MNNEIANVDSKRKSTYQQDLSEIKNELVDKLTKLFNEFVRTSIAEGDQTNNYHTITHIIFTICLLEDYFEENELLSDLDYCVGELLGVYLNCFSKRQSYKKMFEKYKQKAYYQRVQSKFNDPDK